MKLGASLLIAVLAGILLLFAGVHGVLTGTMSRGGYAATGFSAGRTFGCAAIFLALALFRALWVLRTSSPLDLGDLDDGPIRFLISLAAICVALSLPLLFFDIAF